MNGSLSLSLFKRANKIGSCDVTENIVKCWGFYFIGPKLNHKLEKYESARMLVDKVVHLKYIPPLDTMKAKYSWKLVLFRSLIFHSYGSLLGFRHISLSSAGLWIFIYQPALAPDFVRVVLPAFWTSFPNHVRVMSLHRVLIR